MGTVIQSPKQRVPIAPQNGPQSNKNFENETNIVLQDVGTFYWQISAFKCNFDQFVGL